MKIPSTLVLTTLFSSATWIMSANAREDLPHEAERPVVVGPNMGGPKDVTGSNDPQLQDVTEFALNHLVSNSGLHFVQYKAEVQVVAGLKYILYFKGKDDEGTCQEEHKMVVYDKPWMKTREIESDEVTPCT